MFKVQSYLCLFAVFIGQFVAQSAAAVELTCTVNRVLSRGLSVPDTCKFRVVVDDSETHAKVSWDQQEVSSNLDSAADRFAEFYFAKDGLVTLWKNEKTGRWLGTVQADADTSPCRVKCVKAEASEDDSEESPN